MSAIYTPTGRAREYSPLACNIYIGCNHSCKYCYAPSLRRTTMEHYSTPVPKRNILKDFELDCKKNYNSFYPVQFSFMSDPYNALNQELNLTRECLKIALKNKIPISILTKSKYVLNDIDIIKKFNKNIEVGFTLTFDNTKDSKLWEPNASTPEERIETLKKLKENNINTWVSFEPVIYPEQTINLLKQSLDYVDHYKIGKINNYKNIDKQIDWNLFLNEIVLILRSNDKKFYVKHDLRKSAEKIKLYGNEVLMDEFNLNKFED